MERILLTAHYPCLTQLKLLDFQRDGFLHYFTENSPFRHMFRQQIKRLELITKDYDRTVGSLIDYTERLYGHILTCFENLEHLEVVQPTTRAYPGLLVQYLLENAFSPTLTYLCVNVGSLTDCLYILNGRLKQLTTFIVRIYSMNYDSSINHNLYTIIQLNGMIILSDFFVVFNYVVELWVHDVVPFEHEFFRRISKAFPLLKNFHIFIFAALSFDEVSLGDIELGEIIKYPHLTLLDIRRTGVDYVERFLNDTITHLPCLSELRVMYEQLTIITNDFTREATRRNCRNVT